MKTLTVTILVGLAAMAIPTSVRAQQPWTLRQCIDYALEHNISIKQQEVNRQQRELDVSTARNSRLPDLNASASENLSFGRGLTAENTYTNTNTSSTSFSLSTSVPLFTGFRIPNTLEMSRLNLDAATADLEKARNDISVQVAQAYVQILYNMELCDVAHRQVGIDSAQVYRLNEMLRNGKASGTELAQQQAALAQSWLTATQADNEYRLSLLALSQLLELASPEGFCVVRPPVEQQWDDRQPLPPSPDAIYVDAMGIKPEIRAEQLRLQSAEKNIEVARSALLPSLSFGAGIGSNYYNASGLHAESFGRQMSNNFSQYVGLNLSIPIFNRFSTRNSIRSARLSREAQQLQLDNTKKALYKEIQQAYYNVLNSRANYASCQEALRSNKEAYTLMAAKYEYGKATITEFNESKNILMKAESDLARAKYEHLYNNALIDFYRGKALSF